MKKLDLIIAPLIILSLFFTGFYCCCLPKIFVKVSSQQCHHHDSASPTSNHHDPCKCHKVISALPERVIDPIVLNPFNLKLPDFTKIVLRETSLFSHSPLLIFNLHAPPIEISSAIPLYLKNSVLRI